MALKDADDRYGPKLRREREQSQPRAKPEPAVEANLAKAVIRSRMLSQDDIHQAKEVTDYADLIKDKAKEAGKVATQMGGIFSAVKNKAKKQTTDPEKREFYDRMAARHRSYLSRLHALLGTVKKTAKYINRTAMRLFLNSKEIQKLFNHVPPANMKEVLERFELLLLEHANELMMTVKGIDETFKPRASAKLQENFELFLDFYRRYLLPYARARRKTLWFCTICISLLITAPECVDNSAWATA